MFDVTVRLCVYPFHADVLTVSVSMSMSAGSKVHRQPQLPPTHPYKAGREPSFLLIDLAPPPVLVGSVQHLYDIAGLKRQLPIRHGHVVPYRLSVDNRASTYQLEEKDRGSALFYSNYVKILLRSNRTRLNKNPSIKCTF